MCNQELKLQKIEDMKQFLNQINVKEAGVEFKRFSENGEHIFGIFDNKNVVGLTDIEDDKDEAFFYVYIFSKYRKKGYGSAIIEIIEKQLEAKTVEIPYDFYNESVRKFLEKRGYIRSWASTYMSYKGNKFDIPDLPIRNYEETDFENVYYFVDKAFHIMRLSTGWFPDSKLKDPDEESHKWYSDTKKDSFVYIVDNEIVGYVNLIEDEINVVAIKNSNQGKGYGRLLTKYVTNVLIDRGFKEPTLWCVVNNKKARNLYDSLGYKEVCCVGFAKKKLEE